MAQQSFASNSESLSEMNMTTQSLTMSPKWQYDAPDYNKYNKIGGNGNTPTANGANGTYKYGSHQSASYKELTRKISNNYSNPPTSLIDSRNPKTLTPKNGTYRDHRNQRLSHDDLQRTKTDPRGLKNSKNRKNKRSKKEEKKWKKKMKEIGKSHPEFELSYDLLLGIRTSTSTVNSSIIRSSVNPTDDDSSDDDDEFCVSFSLDLSLHTIYIY